jgi:hypothetical protein
MVMAYALAMQALLGAVLTSQAAASAADPFAICNRDSSGAPVQHDGTGKSASHDCVLCTFAKGSHVILGGGTPVAEFAFAYFKIRISWATERSVTYASPTGQYQRGPPAGAGAG